LKKQKKSTVTLPKKKIGMKVLIPLISKRENNEKFIATACRDAHEVFLLLVIDTEAMPGQFGFAASEIGHGNQLMQEVKAIVEKNKKHCSDVMEWGSTESKIIHLVQLHKIDKVVLVKQENQFFKKLVKQLEEKTEAVVEVIEVQKQN